MHLIVKGLTKIEKQYKYLFIFLIRYLKLAMYPCNITDFTKQLENKQYYSHQAYH
jgi:hypothetical protein